MTEKEDFIEKLKKELKRHLTEANEITKIMSKARGTSSGKK